MRSRDDIEMTTVWAYGHRFEVPKALCDGYLAYKREAETLGDAEADRLRSDYEAEHGPLPPPKPSEWVQVRDKTGTESGRDD